MLTIATSERLAPHRPPAPCLAALDDAAPGPSVAVLLNANAKQVNARVRRALSLVVPHEHVFLSESAEQASAIAEEVVARRYRTVFTGGGDGTFVSWVNRILERAERRARAAAALRRPRARHRQRGRRGGRRDPPPRARPRPLPARRGGAAPAALDLAHLRAGRRTPFAGVGIDAAVLNDYVWVKDRLADTPLRRLGLGARATASPSRSARRRAICSSAAPATARS